MQATREIMARLFERAMVPLTIGLGFTGAFLAMLTTLLGMIRGE